MNIDNEKVRALFNSAVEHHPPDEWDRFLDETCGGDDALRERVRLLLNAHQIDDSFLTETGEAERSTKTLDEFITEDSSTQIGPYRLLEKLGEGGMGVVYRAEQKEPVKRRVALKIIKPGMDSRQVIARFEAERQALAMMDHPNIAKVLDAGSTESGRPYFVMELVNGMPLTDYCDEHHLTTRGRLELFVPICRAVQHAHQKGIIHRDLKPSNILVGDYDNQPTPKIIDFGIAKATGQTLTEQTLFTQLGQMVGTLEYMSPEQAELNQLDIDTRCDIYSLGVVLYEVLTGERPFDQSYLKSVAFEEMLRIIREEEPSKPSTKVSSSLSLPSIAANRNVEPARLRRIIRGELDWVVLKAIEKSRVRRYQTASEFAEDIQRFLDHEPVTAGPPSVGYHFRKFAGRHKFAIVMASTILTLLVVGIGVSTWQAIVARHAKEVAIAEAKTSFTVREFLAQILSRTNPEFESNRELTLKDVLDGAARKLDSGLYFQDKPSVEAQLRFIIGRSYAGLGEFEIAESQFTRALNICEKLWGRSNPETLSAINNLASVLVRQQRIPEAEQLMREVLQLSIEHLGETDPLTVIRMNNLGDLLRNTGDLEEAEQLLVKASKTLSPEGEPYEGTLMAMGNLAIVYFMTQRPTEAVDLFERSVEEWSKLKSPMHPDTLRARHNLAYAHFQQGMHEQAADEFFDVLQKRRQILTTNHPDALTTLKDFLDVVQALEREGNRTLAKTWRTRLRELEQSSESSRD